MLHEFIATRRDQIIARCKERVATRPRAKTTEAQIDYGVPLFLDQLITTLRSPGPLATILRPPPRGRTCGRGGD